MTHTRQTANTHFPATTAEEDAISVNRADVAGRHIPRAPGVHSVMMVLELGGEHARIAGTVVGPGIERLRHDYFHGGMSMAMGMEYAIASIEDVLATVPPFLRGVALSSSHADLQGIAEAAGLDGRASAVSRYAVEQVFARQSAVAMGRPAASEGLPEEPCFVPALLLVREIMHHLDIAAIQLGAGPAASPSPEASA